MPEENGEHDPALSPSTLMRRSSTAGRDAFHTATIKGGAGSAVTTGKGMDNYVATTKYSMLTFLPKALYEQVRVMNRPSVRLHPAYVNSIQLRSAPNNVKWRAHELTGELDIVLLGSFGAWPMCTSPWWLCSPVRRCLRSPTTPPSRRWYVPAALRLSVCPWRILSSMPAHQPPNALPSKRRCW
jgi:hypothetical protein